MNITKTGEWIFFTNENSKCLDNLKMGKWMVYFSESSREYIKEMCEKAVNENVVPEAKVATNGDVACFYLNIDEIEYHRKCIIFMLENNLIRKTKAGRYYNVSFKKDIHESYIEKIEKASALSEEGKKDLMSREYKEYNSQIHLCQLYKSVLDISETTGIRISALEKYTSTNCTISTLNIALIASALKCNIEELTE